MRHRSRLLALVPLVLVAALVVPTPAEAQVDPSAPVFVNELHYDNTGTDTGEFVEVAGPAGTDLDGWTIVLYNGNGGAAYDTLALGGIVADQAGGAGTVSVELPSNGIQNGPDGLALVAPDGTVVEFWSYEGVFVAVGGPADGLTSTDLGVSEPNDTAIGLSLQRTGSGTVAGDFTWQPPAAASPGAVNAGQVFGGGPVDPVDPVINEFGASDAGTDDEFVEVYGAPNTDYSAYTVLQIDGDAGPGAGQIDHVVPVGTTDGVGLWATTVPPNSLENGDTTFLLVEGFTGADNDDLDSDGDGILDVEPWTRVVDAVAVLDGGGVFYGVPILDEAFDDGRIDSPFAPGGASRIPDGNDTDAAADWYRNDFDWDGATNGSPMPGEALNTPGAPNALAEGPVPAVLINELDADQVGTDAAEFIELTDGGTGGTALDGLVLVLYNGADDASYAAYDLDGQSTGADGYFVLCGNAATVAGCDLDVDPDTNLIQNGADAAALVQGDADDFPNDTPVTAAGLVDAVVYDTGDADDPGLLATLLLAGGQVDEGANGDQTGHSISRCPDGSGDRRDTSTYDAVAPTPGAANGCDGGPVAEERLISEVQGAGPVAALDGDLVIVQGIVTSLFTDADALDGFFLQEEDADADADPTTSEGIFVFCRDAAGCPATLAVGDLATVTGTVEEFFGMSQIDTGSGSIAIDSSGNPLPTAVPVDLPAPGRTDAEATFESVEGMLVAFGDTLVISEYFQLGRFGQLVLTEGARPEQFTDANQPSIAGYAAFLDELASRRIILDDDNNDQNDAIFGAVDEPYPWPSGGLSITNRFRGGDSITGLTGVLHWSWAGASGTDAWRVRPVDGVDYTFTAENRRPTSPDDVGGSLRVASFNVLNYFTTLDEPGAVCGPSLLDCRGANSIAELDRQRAKIVAAMVDLDADILGLIEIENDEGAAAQDLVDALNGATAPGTYAAIETGAIGGDAIKLALLYRPASVFPVGDHVILDSSIDPRFIDDKNRPVLIQTFEQVSDGARLTVAVNHLKSKGSPCDDVGDPDAGDGQANCNGTRTAAAEALADYLATDPTDAGDGDILIIGDLNAYAMEDPIAALEAAGYADLVERFLGADAYSFVFDGQLGYLDHALANPPLADQVTGVTIWHINADEVDLFDYNDDERDPGEASFERESGALELFGPDPYRSSDHDPVVVGLDLIPTCNGLPATIIGTPGDDDIRGTNGPDVILGRGGDDRIRGGRGDDVICGNQGDDEINGQNEADIILGGRGDDVLIGAARDDFLDGGPGFDTLDGGGQTDTCRNGEIVEACEL
jgi:predicted extracellular nuclease